MDELLNEIKKRALAGKSANAEEALAVLAWPDTEMESLLEVTREVRRRFFGLTVECCGVVNARSGRCGEDCRYCAQSSHFSTRARVYPLLPEEKLLEARNGFPDEIKGRFGMVTSGGAVTEDELERILDVIKKPDGGRVTWCASLGMLDETAFGKLYDAGLRRYHHNLETAESHFDSICSTHSFGQRVATVRAAKKAGLEVCCGALFGLGENNGQRVELASAIRDLEVDSIPLNFLIPVQGTPLAESSPEFSQSEVLRIIAMMRLVCPRTPIRVCAGRERYLAEKTGRAFDAGATGLMIGGYLTTGGCPVDEDLAMIREAGYFPGSLG